MDRFINNMFSPETLGSTARLWLWAVRALTGLMLITAAALKLFTPDSATDVPIVSSSEGQLFILVIEGTVGLWLLSGDAPRGSWLAALILFGLFALASLMLGLSGHSSGGCFGRLVVVSPWATLALDLTVLMFLSTARPPEGAWLGSVGPLAAGTFCVLFLCYLGSSLIGNPKYALASLAGEPFAIEPLTISLDPGKAGEQRSFSLKITNLTDRIVRVVGGTNDCSCVATAALPLEVAPKGSAFVPVRLILKGTPGIFVQQYKLYTDAPGRGVVVARIRGRILE